VAGAVAILRQRLASATAAEIVDALVNSGPFVIDARNNVRRRRLDLAAAYYHATDQAPPSIPGSFSATASAAGASVAISWSASTDDTGIDHYVVQRRANGNWQDLGTTGQTT